MTDDRISVRLTRDEYVDVQAVIGLLIEECEGKRRTAAVVSLQDRLESLRETIRGYAVSHTLSALDLDAY